MIAVVWRDPARMTLSGQTLIGAELGTRYGIRDLDGKPPRLYTDRMGMPANAIVVPSTHA